MAPESEGSSRAERFAISTPLRYRRDGETTWSEGATENISRSGILFWAERQMVTDTPVEMLFTLPEQILGEGGNTTVLCHGRIVRTAPPNDSDPRPRLAATIQSYQILPGARRRI